MQLLESNKTGNNIEFIDKNRLYIKVTDYKAVYFLRHIKIDYGVESWVWVQIKPDGEINLKEEKRMSFDEVINRSVNDRYCSIYSFLNFDELVASWEQIKYINNITTIYKEKS